MKFFKMYVYKSLFVTFKIVKSARLLKISILNYIKIYHV